MVSGEASGPCSHDSSSLLEDSLTSAGGQKPSFIADSPPPPATNVPLGHLPIYPHPLDTMTVNASLEVSLSSTFKALRAFSIVPTSISILPAA